MRAKLDPNMDYEQLVQLMYPGAPNAEARYEAALARKAQSEKNVAEGRKPSDNGPQVFDPLTPIKNAVLKAARLRAKADGYPFSLKVEDLVTDGKCPIMGFEFIQNKGNNGPGPYSPMLDMRDPKLGYAVGNVAIISMRANKLKTNLTLEQVRALVRYLAPEDPRCVCLG